MALKEKEKVLTDEGFEGQVRAFRNDDRGDSFLVFGYGASPNIIRLIAEGGGGLEQAKQHFQPDDSFYALIRKSHAVDLARTTKFAFVDWTSETINPVRKAILATHKGQIKKLAEPFHVSLEATAWHELDDQELNSRIGFVSGTSNYVTTKGALSAAPSGIDALGKVRSAASTSGLAHVPDSVTASRAVLVHDESAIKRAIHAVRDDADPTNWMLASYMDDHQTLTLRGSGEGGVDEMLSHLNTSTVWYGLFRVNEQFDKTSNVRFVHFKYLPSSLPWSAMQRAKISTHQGAVRPLFEPFHTDFDIASTDDLSSAIVQERLQSIMGTKNRVVSNEAAASSSSSSSSYKMANAYKSPVKPVNYVPTSSVGSLIFTDGEEVFRSHLKKVRRDDDPTNWFIASYVKAGTLSVVNSGSGGFAEMKGAFGGTYPQFGLLRVTDVVDKNVTVKFVFLKTLPDGVPPMIKAGLSTKKELLDNLFSPFHTDFFVGNQISELTEVEIQSQISKGSGSQAGSRVR